MTQQLGIQETQIAEYSATAAALADLRGKYENVVFPVETTKGMKDAVAARRELRELRVALEKMRKELKEPALRRCQLIDSEAKEITIQLTALEEPIDKQIKIEEDRKEREKTEKERVERERVEAIKIKIEAISRLPIESANDKSEEIAATIAELEAVELTAADFAEMIEPAILAKNNALEDLRKLHVTAKVREEEVARLAVEREELARQKEEAHALERELLKEREAIARERAELEAMKAKAESSSLESEPEKKMVEENTAPLANFDTDQPGSMIAFDLAAPGSDETAYHTYADADALTRELANYTAMQFLAIARKVRAVGNEVFADELNTIAENIQAGHFNEFIKTADWMEMANADKEMALASHASVALICGDEEMGASVLRSAA